MLQLKVQLSARQMSARQNRKSDVQSLGRAQQVVFPNHVGGGTPRRIGTPLMPWGVWFGTTPGLEGLGAALRMPDNNAARAQSRGAADIESRATRFAVASSDIQVRNGQKKGP